jgi:hypothetical protein
MAPARELCDPPIQPGSQGRKSEHRPMKEPMRKIITAAIIAVLPAGLAAAELPKKTTAPPQRQARDKACASYGPGFVKVDGSSTCVKIGGNVSVEGGRSR